MSYSRNLARLARTGAPVVDSAQALRDMPIYNGLYPEAVQTMGCLLSGDGGGGTWRWDALNAADDNLGTVLLRTGHVGTGRWVRQLDQPGTVLVEMFGAVGDGVTSDRGAVNAAGAWAHGKGGTVRFAAGKRYKLAHIFPFSNVVWDFNRCDIVIDAAYVSALSQKCVFATHFVQAPGTPGNLLSATAVDFRYDCNNPYWGNATGFPPAATWFDEQRPIDTSILVYPAGTTQITMASADHGLVAGDFVFFFSGPHLGTADAAGWAGYQHHEMELLEIASVSGATVYFTDATRMTHRNMDRTAYDVGISSYGIIKFWGLHKIQPNTVCKDVCFRGLRMHVSAADQLGWTSSHYFFSADFVYRCRVEDCVIEVDSDCAYQLRNYLRGRSIHHENCIYSGKLGITFGIDMGQTDHVYNHVRWRFDEFGGYVHAGERFAGLHIIDCEISYPMSESMQASGAIFPLSDECDDVSIRNCIIANYPGAFGDIATWAGWGNCEFVSNRFVGLWHQPPLFIYNPTSKLRVVGNKYDVKLAANRTAGNFGRLLGGSVMDNDFNITYSNISGANNINRNTWVDNAELSTGDLLRKVVFQNNRGIADLHHFVVPGADYGYFASGVTASDATYGLPKFDKNGLTNQELFYPIITPGDHDHEEMFIAVVIRCMLRVTGTGAINFAASLYNATSGVLASAAPLINVSGQVADTPFVATILAAGATTDGKVLNSMSVRVKRASYYANDTEPGALLIHSVEVLAGRCGSTVP